MMVNTAFNAVAAILGDSERYMLGPRLSFLAELRLEAHISLIKRLLLIIPPKSVLRCPNAPSDSSSNLALDMNPRAEKDDTISMSSRARA